MNVPAWETVEPLPIGRFLVADSPTGTGYRMYAAYDNLSNHMMINEGGFSLLVTMANENGITAADFRVTGTDSMRIIHGGFPRNYPLTGLHTQLLQGAFLPTPHPSFVGVVSWKTQLQLLDKVGLLIGPFADQRTCMGVYEEISQAYGTGCFDFQMHAVVSHAVLLDVDDEEDM